ncbi:MAG: ATP-grasp domain-containing protein [Anaerolineaceae bacterium]|nr:MAG: ATP-grasp domain-containing protein [Anaerolineaceae bacterium]
MSIRKILIANRGEIACRIMRTCHDMGIATVAVYSDADADALHVSQAGEAVHIGASPATESYLNIPRIISAATRTGADAVHPGYGFLAENAEFAEAVIDAGLTWIGPSPDSIRAMGKKREAKLMLKDVPLVPGYQGEDQRDETLSEAAEQIGYPVMVKASAGGGGKGMRRVDAPDELASALSIARREAAQAFADDTLILEKFVTNPRHIEIQIFGDQHGNVIAIGERECSIQRRHQKIIEETPSPAVDDDLRGRMSEAAVRIGQQLNYIGAGTVEFLLDAGKNFYFMEMNTRLQVEHPVTEMVYGVDLVRWQIEIAAGKPLPRTNLSAKGHAVEARLYAENPARDFLPAVGDVVLFDTGEAGGVRIDSGIRTGDAVSIHYDPMIAKMIAVGADRQESLRRLSYALARIKLFGLENNVAFLRRVIDHPAHIAGDIHTGFIDAHPELIAMTDALPPPVLIAVGIAQTERAAGTTWRNNRYRAITHDFTRDDNTHSIALTPTGANAYQVEIGAETYQAQAVADGQYIVDGHRQRVTLTADGETWWAHHDGATYHLRWRNPLPLPGAGAAAEGSLRAPMPGQVISVAVTVGQTVKQGDVLMALEAMKMEHRIQSPYDGVVEAVYYSVGDTVSAEAVLLEVTEDDGGG